MGLPVDAEMGRSVEGVVEGCFAALGVFLFARDGEGDDVDAMIPFVWMPGGTGRFILGAAGAWATAVAGDMLPCGRQARQTNGGLGRPYSYCTCLPLLAVIRNAYNAHIGDGTCPISAYSGMRGRDGLAQTRGGWGVRFPAVGSVKIS